MAATIHIPPHLLERVDRRAAELRLSRNRFVAHILEQTLNEESAWSETFLEMLRDAGEDEEARRAVDEMMSAIVEHRSGKKPPEP